MSKRDATKRARELYKKVYSTLNLEDGFSTNLDAILDLLGLELVYYNIDEFVDDPDLYNELKDSSGFLVTDPDGDDVPTIFVNERDPLVRRRFTVAHEIGHYYLKHENSNILMRGPLSSTGINQQEIEANAFAAELLMPEDLFEFLYVDAGLGIHEIANEFGVSAEAAGHRLNSLNLKR